MSVRRRYLFSIGNQAAQLATLTVMFICIARALGPEGKGAVAVVIALPTMLVAAMHFSLPAGAVYYGSRDVGTLGRLAANGVLFTLAAGVPLTAVVWGARDVMLQRLGLDLQPELWSWVTYLVLPTFLVEVGTSLLVGGRRFGRLTAANAVTGLLFIPLFAFVLFSRWASVPVACLLFLGYRLVRALAIWVAVPWREVGPVRPEGDLFRRTLRFSLQGHVGTVMQLAVYRLDLLILNALAGVAATGLYSVATYLAEGIGHVPKALGAVVLPEVAAHAPDQARLLATRVCRQTFWGTLGSAVLLGLLAPVVVPLLFGSAFRPAVIGVWLLLPGVVALALSRVVTAAVVGGGWPWAGSCGAAIALGLTVALDLLLIPRWGMAGAAVASSVAYAAQCVFLVGVYHRQTAAPVREILAFRPADFALVRRAWDGSARA